MHSSQSAVKGGVTKLFNILGNVRRKERQIFEGFFFFFFTNTAVESLGQQTFRKESQFQ